MSCNHIQTQIIIQIKIHWLVWRQWKGEVSLLCSKENSQLRANVWCQWLKASTQSSKWATSSPLVTMKSSKASSTRGWSKHYIDLEENTGYRLSWQLRLGVMFNRGEAVLLEIFNQILAKTRILCIVLKPISMK